ncbi:MAG: hypothetical protein IJU93_07325 [Lachnospiraceae bacterium]|nr:hypothetical protein [Lachnospiraceae bacterium]
MVAVKQANVVQNYADADIVILSREEFEELQKSKHNEEYLAKLDRGFKQAKEGNIIYHDIIEVDD